MILAWLGALVIGTSLGLLGSGGSTLTVPILVYFVGQPDKIAIASSLAIVGSISLFGSLPYALSNRISWRSVLFFGIPAMLGSYGGAHFAQYLSGSAQLVLFAVIMLLAASFMLRPTLLKSGAEQSHPLWKIGLEGLVVGVITGLVGVGGGFLIVPALALLGGLSMQMAVGTSLLIIALQSCVGFLEYHHILQTQQLAIDWSVVLMFSGVGIAGSLIGNRVGRYIPQAQLRRMFSVFLFVVGVFILVQNARSFL